MELIVFAKDIRRGDKLNWHKDLSSTVTAITTVVIDDVLDAVVVRYRMTQDEKDYYIDNLTLPEKLRVKVWRER